MITGKKATGKSKANWIDENLSPGLLFLNGTVFLGLSLTAGNAIDKIIILVCLIVLNLLRKRKLKPLSHLLFILFLILLNIFPPYGKLLFHLFSFPVTEGALLNGLGRGLTLVSLILTAKYCISTNLKLPGTLGKLITRTFYYLELMQHEQQNLKKLGIIDKIDQLILNLWDAGNQETTESGSGIVKNKKSSAAGLIFAIINVLLVIFLLYFV